MQSGAGRSAEVITRAAVLERVGAPLVVTELELGPARAGRGAGAAARQRRLPLGHERDRRHGRDALPGGAGPRGRRRGRGARPRCGGCGRRSRGAFLGAGLRPLRGVPARPATSVRHGVADDGRGGLLDGTSRLSRDGEPIYHYSFLSSFAEHASCRSAHAWRSRATCRSRSRGSSAARSPPASAPSGAAPACGPASGRP